MSFEITLKVVLVYRCTLSIPVLMLLYGFAYNSKNNDILTIIFFICLLFAQFIVGKKANQWAWQCRKWKSIEDSFDFIEYVNRNSILIVVFGIGFAVALILLITLISH